MTNNLRLTNCPYCSNTTHVPDAYLHNDFINCVNCKTDFPNPNKRNQSKSVRNTTLLTQTNSFNITKTQRNWAIAVFVLIVISILGSYESNDSSSNLYTVNHITYAAISKESYDELMECSSTNDEQALSILMLNGQIELLNSGDEVFLVDAHLGYSVVRKQGTTQKLWVVSHALTEK